MRAILLLTSAALMPLAARSGPIYNVVAVRYEGTVSAVRPLHGDAPCLCGYELGDPVSGTLLIQLGNLPLDNAPDRTNVGEYFVDPPLLWPSFVIGAPVRADSRDRLEIADALDGTDSFRIADSESGVAVNDSGRERFELDSVRLGVSSSVVDFIRGDGVLQDFALKGAHVGEGEIRIEREWVDKPANRIGGAIHFILSKLTVKPGVCKI